MQKEITVVATFLAVIIAGVSVADTLEMADGLSYKVISSVVATAS